MKAISEEVSRADLRREVERRLYRINALKMRVEDHEAELKELGTLEIDKLRSHSKSFVSILKPGMRVDPIDAHEAQLALIRSYINGDTREIDIITRACSRIGGDPFYPALSEKYFRRTADSDIQKILSCSRQALWRNRVRLLDTLVTLLYGA